MGALSRLPMLMAVLIGGLAACGDDGQSATPTTEAVAPDDVAAEEAAAEEAAEVDGGVQAPEYVPGVSNPADWALCQLYKEDAEGLTAPWVSAWTVNQTAGPGPTTFAVQGDIEVSVHRADGSLIDSHVIDSYGQTEVASDASYCEVSDFTLTQITPSG